jgi:hypothetical protein
MKLRIFQTALQQNVLKCRKLAAFLNKKTVFPQKHILFWRGVGLPWSPKFGSPALAVSLLFRLWWCTSVIIIFSHSKSTASSNYHCFIPTMNAVMQMQLIYYHTKKNYTVPQFILFPLYKIKLTVKSCLYSQTPLHRHQWRSVPMQMREDDDCFSWAWHYFSYSILDDCHSYSIHPVKCNSDRFNFTYTHHEVATT